MPADTKPAVLVTGGAGYIGSHACKALAEAGFLPIAYDNLSGGHEWAVKWGPLERGDIADRARLLQAIERYKPVAAMHFAAFIAAGESVADPCKYYGNIVAGTLALLEALRFANVTRFVYSSTAAVYGTPTVSPIPESHPLQPINPYGRSKLMVEQVLADYVAAYGFSAVALRYFNAAGADTEAGVGEAHHPETHLIPLLLAAAAGHRPEVTLFGDDYSTADGTCVRDYVHVADLAEAHVLALKESNGHSFVALNLGAGRGYSVKETVALAEKAIGRRIPHRVGPRRPGDPAVLVSEIKRAREVLGWNPARSSLERILADAWTWYRKHYRCP